ACRFFVYPVAASVGALGEFGRVIVFNGVVTGWAVWCGLALAIYVIGLSFIARRESARGPVQYWPLIFLPAPIVLAFVMNTGKYRQSAAILSLVLGLWMLRSLRTYLWAVDRQIGRT